MKIQCKYCNCYMNDTDDVCPSCGAHNMDVVRTTKSQPQTIEELQQWYADRGLPDYETTRFFIGQNYQKPRAFGIYKDPSSGKCIVYKNKDSGQRAIRYEGTDEAYAVNEIFQRLKQEIIEQKMHNVEKAKASGNATVNFQPKRSSVSRSQSTRSSAATRSNTSTQTRPKKMNKYLSSLLMVLLAIFSPFIFIVVLGFILIAVENKPAQGYYQYQGETYYYSTEDYSSKNVNWYKYEDSEWEYPVSKQNMPQELQKDKTAKNYFIQSSWDSSLPCTDFEDSIYYADIQKGFSTSSGYYKYGEDDYYYHLGSDYDSGWYHYSSEDDWTSEETNNVPEDLLHPSMVEDFYYTPTWDTSTQLTDFTDSSVYADYQAEQERLAEERSRSTSYDDDDDDWSSWDDDDDYDWDYDSGDSWDSDYSDWDSDW